MPDAPTTTATTTNGSTGWMSDVQRALALMLIGSFAFVAIFSTVCSIFAPTNAPLVDMAKTLQQAMVNMSLIALGFFFGNTMSKMVSDAGQQKVVEKLTSTQPPTGGPVAPLAAPVVVVSWWSLFTDAEKAAMTAAAPGDAKVAAIVAAAQLGKATPEDLDYLASKNLLAPERATALKAA